MTVKEVCTVTTKYIWGLLLNNYSECAIRQVFETDKTGFSVEFWIFSGFGSKASDIENLSLKTYIFILPSLHRVKIVPR